MNKGVLAQWSELPTRQAVGSNPTDATNCVHKEVFPDGCCTSCGVLATTMPGKVENYHRMVPWLLPFFAERDHENFDKVISGELRPLPGIVMYVQLARPIANRTDTGIAWLERLVAKGWQGTFENDSCTSTPHNHYLKIWGPR